MQRRDEEPVWVWPSSRGACGRDKARWSQESGTLKPSKVWQNATGVYWVKSQRKCWWRIGYYSFCFVSRRAKIPTHPVPAKDQLHNDHRHQPKSHLCKTGMNEVAVEFEKKNLTPCSASCITPRHRWTALYSALSESSHPWICTGHEWWRIPASQKESVLNCSPYLRGSRGRESYELLYKEYSLVPALSSWKLRTWAI